MWNARRRDAETQASVSAVITPEAFIEAGCANDGTNCSDHVQ
jgi:hypothetical protein